MFSIKLEYVRAYIYEMKALLNPFKSTVFFLPLEIFQVLNFKEVKFGNSNQNEALPFFHLNTSYIN